MKGLLKNNFMGVIENLKLLFPLTIIFGIIVSVTGNASLLSIYSLSIAPILSILVVLCMRKETLSKWYKYKLSLPVKRNDIVQSYYISHLCWCIGGMAIVTFFMLLTVIVHGNQYFYYGFRDAITLILDGGILAIFIGSFFYPLYYFFGVEKIEMTAIISLVISVAVIVGISLLINIFIGGDVSDTTYYISLAAISMITCITFVCSYLLSTFIFKTKEY